MANTMESRAIKLKRGKEEKRIKGAKVDHRACKVSHALILSKWVISHSCTQSSYGDSQSTWHFKEVAHSCGRRPLKPMKAMR